MNIVQSEIKWSKVEKMLRCLFAVKHKLAVVLSLSIFTVVVSVQRVEADPSAVVQAQGYKIEFLGRNFNAQTNQTNFQYKVTRGLLAGNLNKLEFPLGNGVLSTPLTNIESTLTSILSYLSDIGESGASFKGPILPLGSANIDLSFLGNVPEGESNLRIQTGILPLGNATIKGPSLTILSEVLNPGTGGGLPSLPTCLMDIAQPIIANVGDVLSIPISVDGGVNAHLNVEYSNWPEDAVLSVPP